MRQRQRMLKCAVLAALFVLGGACTKINAPAANARQTHEAVMAAASQLRLRRDSALRLLTKAPISTQTSPWWR